MTWSDEARGYSDDKGWWYRPRQRPDAKWEIIRYQRIDDTERRDNEFQSALYETRDHALHDACEFAKGRIAG